MTVFGQNTGTIPLLRLQHFKKKESKTIDPIAEKYREIYDNSIKIYDKMLGMSL